MFENGNLILMLRAQAADSYATQNEPKTQNIPSHYYSKYPAPDFLNTSDHPDTCRYLPNCQSYYKATCENTRALCSLKSFLNLSTYL
jgi:hypothetical protein